MTTRIAVTADWHIPPIRGASGALDPETGMPQRFVDHIRTVREIATDAVAAGVDAFLFLGDLWAPVGNTADADQIVYLREALQPLVDARIPIHAIPGNHDGARSLVQHDALAPFEDIMEVHRGFGADALPGGVSLAFVSYHSPEMIRQAAGLDHAPGPDEVKRWLRDACHEAVRLCPDGAPVVLALHQSLDEAKLDDGDDENRPRTMAGREAGLSIHDLPQNVEAVVAGHIHKAQALSHEHTIIYPGSVERVDFGEEGQEKAWIILNVPGDLSYRASFEPRPTAARRYATYNITLDEARALVNGQLGAPPVPIQPGERTRFRVTARSDERWGAERRALIEYARSRGALDCQVVENTIRVENTQRSGVTAGVSPWENVQRAAAESGLGLTDEHEVEFRSAANELIGTHRGGSGAGESLRLGRIEVDGFTALRGVDLDLSGLTCAAVQGPNGAGKSSLFFDSVLWALEGQNLRGDRRNMHDAVCGRSCRVLLELTGPQNSYRVERGFSSSATGKTQSQTLNLWQRAGDEWAPLHGATTSDTQALLNRILGLDAGDPVDILTRTVMLPQDTSGAFARASASDRKAVLSQMLGLHWWDQVNDLLKARAKTVREDLRVAEGQAAILRPRAGELPARQAEARVAEDRQATTAATRDEARARAEEIASQYVERLQERTQAEADLRERRRLGDAIATNTDARRAADAELAAARAVAGRQPELERLRAGAYAASRRIDDMQGASAEIARLADAVTKATEARAAALDDQAARRREMAGKHAEAASAATQRVRACRELLDNEEREQRARIAGYGMEATRAEVAHDTAQGRLRSMTERAAMLDTVPCDTGTGAACPLLADAREARDGMQAARDAADGAAETLRAARATYEAPPEPPSLQAAAQAHRAASEALAELNHWCAVEAIELDNTLIAELWPYDQDIAAAKASYESAAQCADADNLAGLRHEHANLTQRADELAATIAAAAAQVAPLERRVAELAAAVDEAAAAARLLRPDGELAEIIERPLPDTDAARAALREADAAHSQAATVCAVAQENLSQCEAAQEQLDGITATAADFRAREAVLADLAILTGRGGVVARLMDEAVPQVEAAANAALQILTDGQFTIRLQTRAENRDGSTRETLDVEIHGGGDEPRPYETFSVGEKTRIDLGCVLGLSELAKHNSGSRLQWLVLDEFCANLDAAGREVFAECVTRLSDAYPQVFVITHLQEVAAMLPQSVTVIKHDGEATELRIAA